MSIRHCAFYDFSYYVTSLALRNNEKFSWNEQKFESLQERISGGCSDWEKLRKIVIFIFSKKERA